MQMRFDRLTTNVSLRPRTRQADLGVEQVFITTKLRLATPTPSRLTQPHPPAVARVIPAGDAGGAHVLDDLLVETIPHIPKPSPMSRSSSILLARHKPAICGIVSP